LNKFENRLSEINSIYYNKLYKMQVWAYFVGADAMVLTLFKHY